MSNTQHINPDLLRHAGSTPFWELVDRATGRTTYRTLACLATAMQQHHRRVVLWCPTVCLAERTAKQAQDMVKALRLRDIQITVMSRNAMTGHRGFHVKSDPRTALCAVVFLSTFAQPLTTPPDSPVEMEDL